MIKHRNKEILATVACVVKRRSSCPSNPEIRVQTSVITVKKRCWIGVRGHIENLGDKGEKMRSGDNL